MSDQTLLAGNVQHPGTRPRAHDERSRSEGFALDLDHERSRREVDGGGVAGDEPGTEPLGLAAHPIDQIGAQDAVGKAGIVLYLGGERQLTPRLDPHHDERLEVGPRGVDRRGQTSASGSQDDDALDGRRAVRH